MWDVHVGRACGTCMWDVHIGAEIVEEIFVLVLGSREIKSRLQLPTRRAACNHHQWGGCNPNALHTEEG